MWRARLQFEIYQLQNNDCKKILGVLNRKYTQLFLHALRDTGLSVEARLSLDAENTLYLHYLPEPARSYFQEEQRRYRINWYGTLWSDMKRFLTSACIENKEMMVKHYQTIFPEELWQYFEVLVREVYRHIFERLYQWELFDLTKGKLLRICRCYDAACQSLVNKVCQREFPKNRFVWLDSLTDTCAMQEEKLLELILPIENEQAKDFYKSMLHWIQRNKKEYMENHKIHSFKVSYYQQASNLAGILNPPDYKDIANKVLERMRTYYEEKQHEEKVHYAHSGKLLVQIEDRFHMSYVEVLHQGELTDFVPLQKQEKNIRNDSYSEQKNQSRNRWKPVPEFCKRAQTVLPYLVSNTATRSVISWFRYRSEAELFQEVLAICLPKQQYTILKAARHRVSQPPIYGVYETKSKKHFLLAAARSKNTAERIVAIFKMLRKHRGYRVILLENEREAAIDEYQNDFPKALLYRSGFLDKRKSLYEELFEFVDEQKINLALEQSVSILEERYCSLLPEAVRGDWSESFGMFLAAVIKRVRYKKNYDPMQFTSKTAQKEKWRKQARICFGSCDTNIEDEVQPAKLIDVETKQANIDSIKPEVKPEVKLEVKPEVSTRPKEHASDSPVSIFRGIQFDKHIFRHVPTEHQERFRRTFANRLIKMQKIFSGEYRAAGNDFKFMTGMRKQRVFKRRVGDHRLSMVYKDGILTLLALSSHNRQVADIRKIQGKSIGYVYYDTADFLHQLASWPEYGKKKHLSLGDYLATPSHFVFDEDQKTAMASVEHAENLSIIGNAGAGKSVIGLKWLNQELQHPHHDVLYLTMSENLVYTLSFEFEKERLENGMTPHSEAKILTTFDFLREAVKTVRPEIPETKLLNAAQSYAVFSSFWQESVDWTQFWNHMDPDFALQTEEMTRLAAWREIHGIIKGAVPEDVDYHQFREMRENLSPADYQKRLRQEKKASESTALWETKLYHVYRKYQQYLHRHHFFDDNDMARLLLKSTRAPKYQYGAAFVDECQDLTQIELLAIFHLLRGTCHKRMASDRCQMVQPTYFDEGWMRTTSNDYDQALGRHVEVSSLKPCFLHYNYRSMRSIIDFQNYLVQYFRTAGLLTLRQDEMQEITVPPLTPQGMRPVWIAAGEKNRQILMKELWQKIPQSDLQTIFAFPGSRSKQDFPLTEDDAVTDIIHCKGMEYPSVLLYNVLSDTHSIPTMAWKYFYVGATRSNACLIIYEEDAVPGTDLYEFFEDAACEGLIDYANDLMGESDYGKMTWLRYLYQEINEGAAENRLETAEHALDYGQYDLALHIYEAEGNDPNMIAYCRGRLLESRGNYASALKTYAELDIGWSDHGRTRQNAPETMMTRPDIAGREFLAAYALADKSRIDFITEAQQAWHYKYSTEDDHGLQKFYEALFDGLQMYPWMQEALGNWAEHAAQHILTEYQNLNQSICRWPMREANTLA